jgi:tetratricopeptide (TPR) repeat protein
MFDGGVHGPNSEIRSAIVVRGSLLCDASAPHALSEQHQSNDTQPRENIPKVLRLTTGAAQYYYNQGAVLTNSGKVNEADAAFGKSIAADPNKAEAYYQKGVNLINNATVDKTGKIIPAPGTAEALKKYLELQPSGQFAEGAKSMLRYIGKP